MLLCVARFCCILGEEEAEEKVCNNEETRIAYLKSVSEDVSYRSRMDQLSSLEKDGTHSKVMQTLKALVKDNHYTMGRLETLCVGLNVWLYAEPTPTGCVSLNPDTHFQAHRVLRVFLGTEADWKAFKNKFPTAYWSLEDTAFEEKE